MKIRVGMGYDVHVLEEGKALRHGRRVQVLLLVADAGAPRLIRRLPHRLQPGPEIA